MRKRLFTLSLRKSHEAPNVLRNLYVFMSIYLKLAVASYEAGFYVRE